MCKEAIILAGGFGTRLQEAVPELPKCLAPVNGHPFIQYVVNHLAQQGITRIILSLGYRSEQVIDYFANNVQPVSVAWSVEQEPLGTGGAIQWAMQQAEANTVLVVNGDTLCRIDIPELAAFHTTSGALCTLSLKPMQRFNRYGSVVLEESGVIAAFREKMYCEEGLINTGVYTINKTRFVQLGLPLKFSFEKDFLEPYSQQEMVYGFVQNGYFIDIGIPEDYERAQRELVG